jgi:hypothetical protein
MSADVTFDFFVMTGDANHDGTIGFADLVAVAQNYGGTNKTAEQGDFTGDGAVGFPDLVIVAQRYGASLPAAAAASGLGAEAAAAMLAAVTTTPAAPPVNVAATAAPIRKDDVLTKTPAKPVFSVTPINRPAPPKPQPKPPARPIRR